MENLLIVYGNAVEESRYEEMNLWYSWVHIRDVLTNKAAHAAQRFELSHWQPKNADLTHRVLCCYEVLDTEYCNKWHVHDTSTWRMRIGTAFGFDYFETFWTPIFKTADWAEFADYRGERAVMTVKMKAKGKMKVEDYFTTEKLKEMNKLPGFEALHLFDWRPENQMPYNTPPAEPNTHNLVCQISNCYMVANEWNMYLAAHPEIEENFELHAAIYEPQMPRVRGVDLFSKIEWRAIQAIAHMSMDEAEGRAYGAAPADTNDRFMRYPDPEEVMKYCEIERRNFRDI